MTFPNLFGHFSSQSSSSSTMHTSEKTGTPHNQAYVDFLMEEEDPPEMSWTPTADSRHLGLPMKELMETHALRPLVDGLKEMIASPGLLLSALTNECTRGNSSTSTPEGKLQVYQSSHLLEIWRSAKSEMSMASARSTAELELEVLAHKVALYYLRLWQHIAGECVKFLHKIETRSNGKAPLFQRCLSPVSESAQLSSGMTKRSKLTRKSNEFLVGWFLAHKSKPYPTHTERVDIAKITGLTEQQVRNWFANMRKRHWKPSNGKKKPRCLLDVVLRQSYE